MADQHQHDLSEEYEPSKSASARSESHLLNRSSLILTLPSGHEQLSLWKQNIILSIFLNV